MAQYRQRASVAYARRLRNPYLMRSLGSIMSRYLAAEYVQEEELELAA
jgi:hypothetical protein